MDSLRRQIAIAIKQSEARARKVYAIDASSMLQRYGILVGFLKKIAQRMGKKRDMFVLYFPAEARQLYCAYKERGVEEFKLIEMRDHLTNNKRLVQEIAVQRTKDQMRSLHFAQGEATGSFISSAIFQLVQSVLADRITPSFLDEASVLLIYMRVPTTMPAVSLRCQDLTGLLLLMDEKNRFPDRIHYDTRLIVQEEFEKYLESIRRFASYEPDFFVSSLVDQDVRIQESAVRGIGYATYMLQHRFRNLRQAAQFVSEHFQTVDDILADPILYEESVKDMSIQLEEALRLENILRNLAERPEIIPQTVEEVKEVFESLFYQTVKSKGITAKLKVELDESLLKQQIIPPHRLIEEVFLIHLDNSLREIAKDETTDKRLVLEVYEQGNYTCFAISNFGPPVPPDVLEDLERVARVRQPQRTGLGVFLSAMILQQVEASFKVRSPVRNGIGTTVTLRFRKYIS